MKNLTSFVREGLITRYKVEDIDIEEFKRIAEKIGNDKDGLGAVVGFVAGYLFKRDLSQAQIVGDCSTQIQIGK